VQYLKNMIYWEERWHLQHYDFESTVVGLVDYRRVLRLAGSEESIQGERAIRRQRMRASEAIPWPVVDEKGNVQAVNRYTGLFEQMNSGAISPKTIYPPRPVEVEFPDLWWKLQAFRRFGECEDDRDGYVRAWAVDQLEVRHPFMYQAFLAEGWEYSAEDQQIYGTTTHREPEPGLNRCWEWPGTRSNSLDSGKSETRCVETNMVAAQTPQAHIN
jgi:hypothetical protein